MHTRSPTINSNLTKHCHTRSSIVSPSSKFLTLPPIDTNFHSTLILSQDMQNMKSPKSRLQVEDSKKRHKDFLELMGFCERSPVSSLQSPLTVGKNSPKISVTDLMGTKKFSFLKQSGFLPIYYECKRTQEHKKLIEGKNNLSHANIVHNDLIRENNIRSPNKLPESCVEFKRYKKRKRTTKKIIEIEEIFKQCDALSLSTKQAKRDINHSLPSHQPETKLKAKPKLTSKELNSIQLAMHKIE